MISVRSLAAIVCSLACQAAPAPQCKRFDEIYPSGKELCENMWNGAFKYEPDESKAYTMWFFDKENPNDAVSRALGKLDAGPHTDCHLEYYHKSTAPGPEPDTFTECHPWKENACCIHGTVETHQKLKEGYGKEYHWDRCGPLSRECESFFVHEACLYECDPNAGLFRKFHAGIYNKSNPDHNAWQMEGMPIKASYCDAWFTACRKDKFCASAGGDYFSCAAEYKAHDSAADKVAALEEELKTEKKKLDEEESEGLDTGIIIAIVSGGIVIFALLVCFCLVIMREKAGKPLFGKLVENTGGGAGGQAVGASQF